MPAATSPTKVLAYRAMRGLGHPRTRAADIAGVSVRTAQRLDNRDPARCSFCGATLNREDHDAHEGTIHQEGRAEGA